MPNKKKLNKLVHKILILDCELKKSLNVKTAKKDAEKFTTGLMKLLGMKPLGPFSFFEAVDETEPGWSFIQPITTSHISAHYFSKLDPLPQIHIDIYSCKEFSWKKVIIFLEKKFILHKYYGNFITRDMKKKRSVVEMTKMYK